MLPMHVLLFISYIIVVCQCNAPYEITNTTTRSYSVVVVPAVMHEFQHSLPYWMHKTIQEQNGFTTFVYQKLDSSLPNYISTNQGSEAGVYLRYIVDHYENFPDVAVFIHGRPEDHHKNWLNATYCVKPNGTYSSLSVSNGRRATNYWHWHWYWIWLEQCMRDVLQIVWGMEDQLEAFHKLLPANGPITVNFDVFQQFVLSRQQVHKRPLSIWKRLLEIIGIQKVCHVGEPDYENNFNAKVLKTKCGPEPESIVYNRDNHSYGHGRFTQGLAMEHLAHVVFGMKPLSGAATNMRDICDNFYADCPGSPCKLP